MECRLHRTGPDSDEIPRRRRTGLVRDNQTDLECGIGRPVSDPVPSLMTQLARKSQHVWTSVSPEPGCSRDQEQACPDGDGPRGSGDALTGRCETLDGDGCRQHSHHAKVHDPDDQEDRHQTETAVAAVEAEVQAVSPGRAGVAVVEPGRVYALSARHGIRYGLWSRV